MTVSKTKFSNYKSEYEFLKFFMLMSGYRQAQHKLANWQEVDVSHENESSVLNSKIKHTEFMLEKAILEEEYVLASELKKLLEELKNKLE